MTDGRLHCSVHVVRLTVDSRSFSICYHEPPLQTRSAKTPSRRSFFGLWWRPRNHGCAVRQSKPVLCEQHCQFSSQKKTEESFRCSLNSSLRIDLDLRVTRWRERAPEREEASHDVSCCIADSDITLHIIVLKKNMSYIEVCIFWQNNDLRNL